MEQDLWITDLKIIEDRALRSSEANFKFSEFLKTQDGLKIDKLVTQLSQNVAGGVDCKKCANCCKSLTVAVHHQDAANLAATIEIETNDFKAQFMKRDLHGDMVFKQHPCPFLKKDMCSVYENRPSTCRTYPHLEKENFIARLGNVLSNLKVCPIAYNTFELLKLNFE